MTRSFLFWGAECLNQSLIWPRAARLYCDTFFKGLWASEGEILGAGAPGEGSLENLVLNPGLKEMGMRLDGKEEMRAF